MDVVERDRSIKNQRSTRSELRAKSTKQRSIDTGSALVLDLSDGTGSNVESSIKRVNSTIVGKRSRSDEVLAFKETSRVRQSNFVISRHSDVHHALSWQRFEAMLDAKRNRDVGSVRSEGEFEGTSNSDGAECSRRRSRLSHRREAYSVRARLLGTS